MSRLQGCCTIIILALFAYLAQTHGYEDCCARCKEVSDSCRKSRSTDCDAKFIGCMKGCLQEPSLKNGSKGDETTPDKGERPKSNIPEISDPRKLDELKQQL